jgi:hypothetical protein
MEHKKVLTLGAILVALVAVIGISASTLAATNDSSPNNKINNPQWQENHQQQSAKREAVMSALGKADYQAWLQAVGPDSKQATIITAEKFPRLVEAYKLEQEAKAKLDEAKKIREELGLQPQQRGMKKFNHGLGKNNPDLNP